MRKILLATTALIGFVGTAQAAESPVSINVGGYVDFRAAMFREATNNATTTASRRNGDFLTEYRLNFAAEGKAANGIEYGAMLSLWNGDGAGTDVVADKEYVWLSGAFGKILMGDEHGASDLYVTAPTVGEGQIDGSYTDFTDHSTLSIVRPSFFNMTETSTKITYYTPKVGNANHKVQVGVSFAPNQDNRGQSSVKYESSAATYQNAVESTVRYTGSFGSVGAIVSGMIQTADAEKKMLEVHNGATRSARAYFGWGLGTQVTYAGLTVGGSYTNGGHANSFTGQDKEQDVWTLGAKYEFDKVAVALNGMSGRGYNNGLTDGASNTSTDRQFNYVKDFKALGLGATYTWFPGLTSAADVVLFAQDRADIIGAQAAQENDGHVLMLSQKMAF